MSTNKKNYQSALLSKFFENVSIETPTTQTVVLDWDAINRSKFDQLVQDQTNSTEFLAAAVEELYHLSSTLREINFTKRSEFPGDTAEQKTMSWKQIYYSTRAKIETLGTIVFVMLGRDNPVGSLQNLWPWERKWRTRN